MRSLRKAYIKGVYFGINSQGRVMGKGNNMGVDGVSMAANPCSVPETV